jgi:hypothetical protein
VSKTYKIAILFGNRTKRDNVKPGILEKGSGGFLKKETPKNGLWLLLPIIFSATLLRI